MDKAGLVLVDAHQLYARNSTSSSSSSSTSTSSTYKAVGIILAVCSGLFIGTSFVIKKVGLLKANKKYNEAAGEGYGYLKNAWWWLGMTLMIIGELCNFAAYAFVDAILVTPFGALSVVVTTILSAIFLKERLSFVGKVGCFNCIIGAVVIAINAPEESSAADIQEMQAYVISPGFLVYGGIIILGCLFIALWVAPRWGKKSMFVYITICSLIGGLSVVATQGLGSAIVAQASGTKTDQFTQWFLYVLLVFVVCTLLTEIIYLNKALNIFNAALVTPTYYVMFTSATIITSAILFKGFHGTVAAIISVVMGFLFICSGVVLLQLAKSSKDVPDTAIFKGDLDQVRTIAEQEEPESEPRADTIRGGAAIVRAISKKRTLRQLDEAKSIYSERMEAINENESVYFDGLRRRKTVIASPTGGVPAVPAIPAVHLQRQKTVHPPLGMSHFPDEDEHSDAGSVDTDVHPGFHLPKFMTRRKSSGARQKTSSTTEMKDLEAGGSSSNTNDKDQSRTSTSERNQTQHVYGLPAGLQHHDGASDFMNTDTSYRGATVGNQTTGHIAFASDMYDRPSTGSSSLAPPKVPPHSPPNSGSGSGSGSKRTFSFQNVFHRNKGSGAHIPLSNTDDEERSTTSLMSDSGTVRISSSSDHRRPMSRSAFSYSSRKSSYARNNTNPVQETEEERLGLVKGDSHSPSQTRSRAHSGGDGAAAAAAAATGAGASGAGYRGYSGIAEHPDDDDEDDDDEEEDYSGDFGEDFGGVTSSDEWLIASGRSESPEDILANGDLGFRARMGEDGGGGATRQPQHLQQQQMHQQADNRRYYDAGSEEDEADVDSLAFAHPRQPQSGL